MLCRRFALWRTTEAHKDLERLLADLEHALDRLPERDDWQEVLDIVILLERKGASLAPCIEKAMKDPLQEDDALALLQAAAEAIRG